MDNVISLNGGRVENPAAEPQVNPQVVEVFERLLADAKAGVIHGIVGALATEDHEVGYVVAGTVVPFPMIGVMEMIKIGLIEQTVEE